MYKIGVDVGGTNIRAAIVDNEWNIIEITRTRTPNSSKQLLETIVSMIEKYLLTNKYQFSTIGIGISGIINPITGMVVGAGDTMPGWLGTDIRAFFRNRFPIPIYIDNDVNVAGLGEMLVRKKNGLEMNRFVYLSIGTGLGGALINDGKVIRGKDGGAGEFGHSILYPNGIQCGCGKLGCAEKYISGTALHQLAREIDEEWDSYTLIKQYEQGHSLAKKAVRYFLYNLAIMMLNIQSFFDPDQVVIGGGLASSFYSMSDDLNQALKDVGFQRSQCWTIAHDGENIGVIGAANLSLY